MNYAIIIPALEPEQKLISYVDELLSAGITQIIVVNDGSTTTCDYIFNEVARKNGCVVLTHEKNRGKGAAIKTALEYYKEHLTGFNGVITADCDGQHCVSDVLRLCNAMDDNPGAFVLGCRNFNEGTPGRSLAGNKITSFLMRLLYGINLSDTQTGLRGLPSVMIEPLISLSGDRYEYELNMLIYAQSHCIPFVTVAIETIYFDNNAGSHYRPVIDSARIFIRALSGLAGFCGSALCSGLTDILIYTLMVDIIVKNMPDGQRLFVAAVTARVMSSAINFMLNRKLPQVQNTKISSTMPKYYTLLSCQLMISYLCVYSLHTLTDIDEKLFKIIVDFILAIFSYQVQMRWVFRSKNNDNTLTQEEELI